MRTLNLVKHLFPVLHCLWLGCLSLEDTFGHFGLSCVNANTSSQLLVHKTNSDQLYDEKTSHVITNHVTVTHLENPLQHIIYKCRVGNLPINILFTRKGKHFMELILECCVTPSQRYWATTISLVTCHYQQSRFLYNETSALYERK